MALVLADVMPLILIVPVLTNLPPSVAVSLGRTVVMGRVTMAKPAVAVRETVARALVRPILPSHQHQYHQGTAAMVSLIVVRLAVTVHKTWERVIRAPVIVAGMVTLMLGKPVQAVRPMWERALCHPQ